MVRKFTTEDFIVKAKKIHGDRYDYSKVNYINSNTKITLICKNCGNEFKIEPNSHLTQKSGCRCYISYTTYNTTDWITKAKEVHGDKYDYSKTEYIDWNNKVCIICPEHGEFWKIPSQHIQGQGCPKCQKENDTINKRKRNLDNFISKAKKKFGNRYDYSKVEYKGVNIEVCIICPEHGEVWMKPSVHLANRIGCIKCTRKVTDTETFIEKSTKIHNNRYNYSKVKYINAKTEVCIICPEHGEFWQLPFLHSNGVGCPVCNVGYTRKHKFNLINDFIDEFRLRDFLMSNDENIIYIILRNIEKIEPKFNPIVKDIERVLWSDSIDPISDLQDKYRIPDETVEIEPTIENHTITNVNDIDLDDDDAVEAFISSTTTMVEKTEPTIEDLTRARENEIKLINTIEHMLTPEERQFIKDKFLNDKRRNWMLERDKTV